MEVGLVLTKVKKRDGRIVKFDEKKIFDAIYKAMCAVGGQDTQVAAEMTEQVVDKLKADTRPEDIPTVEQVQDTVEAVLVKSAHYQVAKEYILYRELHKEIRGFVDEYLMKKTWLVKENSNMGYSLQALNNHISSQIISNYWLHRIYKPVPRIRDAHKNGEFHIHDLSILGPYCVGWDLNDLLMSGFRGVRGKISSRPSKHFRVALGQAVNFFFTMQGESAGAQAFSNFDTYLAPFIRYDNLDYKSVKQSMQEFMYNINVPTRVGFQTPFTNVTLDLSVPKFMKDERVTFGGKTVDDTYGDFQPEMDIFNKALADVMMEGDSSGRVFTFPIPTINLTKDFDWDSDITRDVFSTSAKYGIPYFANFVNSDMSPDDVRSMCCRLRLDKKELRKRGGGLFGANPLTGSIGVMTINMPRIGYLAKDENDFFERLEGLMDLSKNALEIKRQWLEKFTNMGLYPYSNYYLRTVKEATGHYWKNHFSTIGLVGMNEACLNFMDCNMANEMGIKFSEKVLKFMRNRLQDFQEETGNMYNLEATPAEGTSYRLARIDKQEYPKIQVANEKRVGEGGQPYYTNSTQLPVYFTDDLWESLRLQEPLQTKYTGGTVFHIWLGESNPPVESMMNLMKKIVNKSSMPYFTLTPTFSVCDRHGYLKGEKRECPKCKAEGILTKCEVYSRVVGYLRPVDQWNDGKQEEFAQRKMYDKAIALAR